MHLERVLIVVERRDNPDGSFAAFDLWNIKNSLRFTGLVDKIEVLYYSDYDGVGSWLVTYCEHNKPDIILLSLQSMVDRGGSILPEALGVITCTMRIPTVLFWWSIFANPVVDMLEQYSDRVSLNIIGGADSSSHKPIHSTNHIYAGLAYDESLFDKPDGTRDIPVGMVCSKFGFRKLWFDELERRGIPVFNCGGQLVDGTTNFISGKVPPLWLSYDEYLATTARMKIALNFSSGNPPNAYSLLSTLGQLERVKNRISLKDSIAHVVRNPLRLRYLVPTLRKVKKPYEMTRGRVFEALWTRTFLLEEYNKVTTTYFEPYVDYVPFTTANDLVDKIRFYLGNDDERDKIRLHGRATVEKYYNARIYWQNLFEILRGEGNHHPGEIWNKEHFDKWLLSAVKRNRQEVL